MKTLLFLTVICLMVSWMLLGLWWYRRSGFVALQRWADQHKIELQSAKICAIDRGPFSWTVIGRQRVFRISVADGPERTLSGWVCLGSTLFGLFSDEVYVEWDRES